MNTIPHEPVTNTFFACRAVLALIGPHLRDCVVDVRSNHSDTEVGRCVYKFAGEVCRESQSFLVTHVYYQQNPTTGEVAPNSRNAAGQTLQEFLPNPKGIHFRSGVIHPIKSSAALYRFHQQSTSHLRPPQPLATGPKEHWYYKNLALADTKRSCVHNPAFQLYRFKYPLPECPAIDLLPEVGSIGNVGCVGVVS